jgi:hypothetical protein
MAFPYHPQRTRSAKTAEDVHQKRACNQRVFTPRALPSRYGQGIPKIRTAMSFSKPKALHSPQYYTFSGSEMSTTDATASRLAVANS